MVKLKTGAAELQTLAHMLRKVEFFSPLTVGQLEEVLPYITLQEFKAEETVFRQGEPGDAFYIVYRGRVVIRIKPGLLSFSQIVTTLGPGDFFGEIALLSRSPRNATVVCAEPTQLFTLVATDFEFVLKQNPPAALEMKRIAARRRFESAHQ